MKELNHGVLEFKDGWNGGMWMLDGAWLDTRAIYKNNPKQKATAKVVWPDGSATVETLELHPKAGTDYDHGHEYDWTAYNWCFLQEIRGQRTWAEVKQFESVFNFQLEVNNGR